MVKLASAARIIQKPEPLQQTAAKGEAVCPESDLFTTDELFGVKQDQYLKKNRSRVLADLDALFAENRWQDIVSLYHPVEEKLPELDKADMADMIREKIAFAFGQLKQFDDAIAQLQTCISHDPDNYYTRSSLAYTAYSSLFAAQNREIFLSGNPRARRIELAHENFDRARELRPDGVTNFYRHAMLYARIQGKNKPALNLLEQAIANWENLTDQEKDRRHQEKKNYVKSLYRSASVLLETGEATRSLSRIQACLKQDEKTNHISLCFKYFALGKVQFSLGQLDLAKDALRFSLQSSRKGQPVDFVHELLARTCMARGEVDQALDTLDKVPERLRRPYFRWTEADALCMAGQYDRAAQILIETASKDSRSRHIALVRLAKISYTRGEFETGAGHAGRGVAFFREKWGNPYYEGLFWQALCACKAGQTKQAHTCLEELETCCPHYPKLNQLSGLIKRG
ncbi:MAG: tetratricopeptide repeat protein [Desulfotignum sp.]